MPYLYDPTFTPAAEGVLFFDLPDRRVRADALIPYVKGRRLWSIDRGCPYQLGGLLAKIESECINRALPLVRLCFHHDPLCFGLLIGDDRCVICTPQLTAPLSASCKSLAPLLQKRLRADDPESLEKYSDEADKIFRALERIRSLAISGAQIESELLAPYILADKLDAFSERLVKKLKVATGRRYSEDVVCRTSIWSGRPVSFRIHECQGCQVLPIIERIPALHFILDAIRDELAAKGASFVRYVDYFGRTEGIFIPSANIYIGPSCEGAATEKPINAARFVSSAICEQKELLRSIRAGRDALIGEIDILEKKIVGLYQKIDEIYENATSKSDFERFGKDLLIEIFK